MIVQRLFNVINLAHFILSMRANVRDIDDISAYDPYVKKSAFIEKSQINKGSEYKSDYSFGGSRGLIAYKEDITKAMKFQFNPEDFTDNFNPVYEDRTKTGMNKVDYFWVSGSARTVEFTLFLDATEGSNQDHIGKSTFDLFTHDPQRGVLNQVEFLQGLKLPYEPTNTTPLFIRGNSRKFKQFYPPPEIVFIYGYFYLEGVLTAGTPKYTLFNRDLIPMRAEIPITLRITDGSSVNINSQLTNIAGQFVR
jgi:Contractile injection system tube protein